MRSARPGSKKMVATPRASRPSSGCWCDRGTTCSATSAASTTPRADRSGTVARWCAQSADRRCRAGARRRRHRGRAPVVDNKIVTSRRTRSSIRGRYRPRWNSASLARAPSGDQLPTTSTSAARSTGARQARAYIPPRGPPVHRGPRGNGPAACPLPPRPAQPSRVLKASACR